PQLVRGGHGLWHVVGDVRLIEQHLPLEIRHLDEVAVDDADETDAGPDQVVGQHRAEGPAAADGDPRPTDPLLPGLANAGHAGLAGVTLGGLEFNAHGHSIGTGLRTRSTRRPRRCPRGTISGRRRTAAATSALSRTRPGCPDPRGPGGGPPPAAVGG